MVTWRTGTRRVCALGKAQVCNGNRELSLLTYPSLYQHRPNGDAK